MKKKRQAFWDYGMLLAGSALVSLVVKCIYDPAGLVTGGVSGFSIIVKNITGGVIEGGFPLWLTSTALNLPLFLVAGKLQGVKTLLRTLVATVGMSVFLAVIPDWVIVEGDILLAAVFGGVLSGVGLGMVLGAQATTGGTDLLASLVRRKLPHYSVAQILQVIDGAIVLGGAAVFGINLALYAVITIYIVSKISDAMIEGWKFSKQAFIISDKSQEIAERVMLGLDRGITGFYAKGMYSGQERKVLMCVVSKKEIVRLKQTVMEIDSHAFIIVSDAREVLGEGFVEITHSI